MGETLFGDDNEEQTDEESEVIDADYSEVDEEQQSDLPSTDEGVGIVKPVDNIDEVVEVYDQFEELKDKLLDFENDVVKISGNPHIMKSGWRKIATAFNLDVEVTGTERSEGEDIIRYKVVARATAPNGKTITSSALCASNESNFMETLEKGGDWYADDDDVFKIDGKYRRLKDKSAVNEHNLMTIAETRAKNRAISDLVGGGEVSAEEMGEHKKKEILE